VLHVVALVGRPNVGKSTLFNALTGQRDAIVADFEGLTRDRRYGTVSTEKGALLLVDTGGLCTDADPIQALTAGQARAAINESHVVVFMVDGRQGLTPEDLHIAAELRTIGKPVVLAVNKTDGLDETLASAEFHELGFGEPVPIAAAHRRGTKRLLAGVDDAIREEDIPLETSVAGLVGVRVAIVGRPNVGKSTLVNRLLGEERVIAFDQPGTTRDTVLVGWEHDGQNYVLMDTAGVRRRSKVSEAVEKFSIIKALQAIEQCDVVVVMVDATEGVVDQDSTILGYVLESGRALVVAVNKWDGLSPEDRIRVREGLDRKLRFVTYAERIMISALHGSGLGELIDGVNQAYESAFAEFGSSRLTHILTKAVESHQPPMVRGRTARMRYAHLGGHNPVRIVIHGSRTNTIPEAYRRYLANTFRKELGLTGTPLRLDLRSGDNPFKDRKNVLTARQLQKRRRLKKFVSRKKRK
jgi:GTP-binding protein